MRRTIEKLTRERIKKEQEFSRRLDDLKAKSRDLETRINALKTEALLTRLEELAEPSAAGGGPPRKKRFFRTPSPDAAAEAGQGTGQAAFNRQVLLVLQELRQALAANLEGTRALLSGMAGGLESASALVDARDREWDALGSNHTGMIFKSMEWRVDKLAAAYEEASLLMKSFAGLKEKLNSLAEALGRGGKPEPEEVRAVLEPLEDIIYAGFENRYRGSAEEVKAQQKEYLEYFSKGKKVLDLGCGRGEFLELLQEKGIACSGVDANGQMISICRDKGLDCRKADILEALAGCEDGSLGGVFSSQVIEHLPPPSLKRMIELSCAKLAPGSPLILETVNPTSVFALVQIYFLDLSHDKPIHPQALRFLMESAGFSEVAIKYGAPLGEDRLQELPAGDEAAETAAVFNRNIDKLNKLLFAPPNYAAIGIKR